MRAVSTTNTHGIRIRNLFQEHSLNGHDDAGNRNVRRQALTNYGELVKNRSKPSFVGSYEPGYNWDAAVFQQRASNDR